jgi:hypothetical protein
VLGSKATHERSDDADAVVVNADVQRDAQSAGDRVPALKRVLQRLIVRFSRQSD